MKTLLRPSLLALSCITLALAGCGGANDATLQGNIIGQQKIGLPGNWPSDAPAYPGSNVQFSGVTADGASAILTTSDDAAAVASFYATQLAAQGWTVKEPVQAGTTTAVTANKGSRSFGATLTPANGLTTITLGILTVN